MGEGSAACGMGLIMGVFILVLQKYLSEDAVHNLLTFNPADFFVCVCKLSSPVHYSLVLSGIACVCGG